MVMVKVREETHSFNHGHQHTPVHGHRHVHHHHGHNSPVHTLKSLFGKYRHLRCSSPKLCLSTPKSKRLSESKRNCLGGEIRRPFLINKKGGEDNDSVFIKEDFKLGKLLGAGGFGSVYMANGKSGHGSMAIKVLKKPTMSKNPDAMFESFKAELRCMQLSHPNVVQSLGATHMTSFEEGAWVVMEYVGERTLQAVLNESQVDITIELRLKFAIQIAQGLKYLHDNSIVHLDIKPANILITPDGDCKIGDLGCSQILEEGTGRVSPTQRSSLTGTFAYRAPELLRGDAPTRKADIYSFGITMWQMLARDNPYGNENQHVVIFGVVAYGHRPKHPNMSEQNPFELCYRDLYSQCWDSTPQNRPSADELVEVLDIWKNQL
ncbi:serine/threonine-protein kinase mos-like [Mizuhopecten yessoensis]|uniref:non-specific serine/threonine protein kinase n=1 Tax=Mizuhopecten yessoensis TaxID=6573 RepID=A0A210PEJ7_MIZYE|nr:serine/threonine-protein kinase mos-like [Mizuhopecten yessoensis]OWF34904.1 Serine/threonine-protein kinase mos [Mizuhopecten yessoensis]